MTGANLAALIRKYTGTNVNTLPNTDIVLLANTVKDDFAPEIMKADEDLFGVIATAALVQSGDVGAREYPIPDDNLRIIRVEAHFDPAADWVKLNELDLTKYKRTTDEDAILENFSNNDKECFYDIYRRSLIIYSGEIIAVAGGLKLYHIAYPADITAGDLGGTVDLSIDPSSTTSQLPRQFHELWARKVSILWKGGHEKPIPLSAHELNFERDFKKKMDSITNPNQDREVTGSVPYDDGSQY